MSRWTFPADAEQIGMGYKLAVAGKYLLGVDDKLDQVSTKNYPQVNLTIKVVKSLEPDKEESEGATFFQTITQIPKGLPGHGLSLAFLKALGLPYSGDVDFDTDDMVGRTFVADVGVREYTNANGEARKSNTFSNPIQKTEYENALAAGGNGQRKQTSNTPAKARKF